MSHIIRLRTDEDGSLHAFLSDDKERGYPLGAELEDGELKDFITANGPAPAYVGPTDLENWIEEMDKTDRILPRFAEDILDGMPDKSGVAQITLDRLQEKKDLREAKP